MEAARSTGQVRLVKTIQQRLQVKSNEENPPVHIDNNSNSNNSGGSVSGSNNSASSYDDRSHTLNRTERHVSVTLEVDPFPDQWGAVAPPPIHSPPPDPYINNSNSSNNSKSKKMIDEQISGNSYNINVSGSSNSNSGNESSDLSDDESTLMMAETVGVSSSRTGGGGSGGGASARSSIFQDSALIAAANASARSNETTVSPPVVNHTNYNVNQEWTEMFDNTHQLPYYQHKDGHSQWEMPNGFISQWGENGYQHDEQYYNSYQHEEHNVAAVVETEDTTTHRSSIEDTDHWSQRYDENWEENEQVDEELDVFTSVPPPPVNGPGEEDDEGEVQIERSISFSM
jgi:hypothetical protein